MGFWAIMDGEARYCADLDALTDLRAEAQAAGAHLEYECDEAVVNEWTPAAIRLEVACPKTGDPSADAAKVGELDDECLEALILREAREDASTRRDRATVRDTASDEARTRRGR